MCVRNTEKRHEYNIPFRCKKHRLKQNWMCYIVINQMVLFDSFQVRRRHEYKCEIKKYGNYK